jgi:aspartate beta-hydroxylase
MHVLTKLLADATTPYLQVRSALRLYQTLRKANWDPSLKRLRDVYVGPGQIKDFASPLATLLSLIANGNPARFRNPYQRPAMYFPFLAAKPVHERNDNAAILEKHAEVIRREYHSIQARLGSHPEGLVAKGVWDIYKLYGAGAKHRANCQRCPVTTRVIESLPHCCDWIGLAYFSVLQPGTHIRAHCGRTNARIRYHLGIETPDGAHLRVTDQTVSWERNKCLIFDDSFEHEVCHTGKHPRVVLVVDLWHPELLQQERELLEDSILEIDW